MNEGAAAISLKAFWDAIEQRLASYSADDLRAILRTMAQEMPPSGRQEFLARLAIKPDAGVPSTDKVSQEDLLSDIDDWIAEVNAQRQQAQRWEKRHGYDWDERYDDEDSLGPYAEFVEPLIKLFDRAEGAFDYGNVSLARQAYYKLFTEALGLEDEYGRGVRVEDLSGLDVPKTYARYLRAVYESEPVPQRATVMFDQMVEMRTWLPQSTVMLGDVIRVSPQPLPDQDLFLRDWIALLRQHGSSDADAWLREAIRLAQGTAGLEALARAEGLGRPLAFRDWVAALEGEQKPDEVIAAAQLALETLPPGITLRAELADYLCRAAATLNEVAVVRSGRWQAFLAQPVLVRLLDVWAAVPDRAGQTDAMQRAARHIAGQLAGPRPDTFATSDAPHSFTTWGWTDKGVLVHAHLLAQEWDAAGQLAADEDVLGWNVSSTAQGFVVPFFLALLSGDPPAALPANVVQVWRGALQNTAMAGSPWASPQQTALANRLEQVYRDLIGGVTLDPTQAQPYLAWCVEITRRRVNAIVTNQERGYYDQAAALAAACAEVLRKRGQGQEGNSLLNEVRDRFPRHRAFQAELRAAVERMKTNRL